MDTGSFGDTVMTLVCKRIAYLSDLADEDGQVDVRGERYREVCRGNGAAPEGAPAELKAVQAKRAELVAAVDAMFPGNFLDELQGYVTGDEFLTMYDDGTAEASVAALAGMLRLLADDAGSLQALERFGHRSGYTPAEVGRGLVDVVLDYQAMPDFLRYTAAEIAPGGSAHEGWSVLLAGLGATLRNLDADPGGEVSAAELAWDLLFAERASLPVVEETPIVVRDIRGVARAAEVAPGQLAAPFVDLDGDGLADADALGRYVDGSGQVLAVPSPFAVPGEPDPGWITRDGQQRAIVADTGQPLYTYLDLDRTLLTALARDGAALMNPAQGLGFDALLGMSGFMGPRQAAERVYDSGDRVAYTGFVVAESALLDMLYGYLQLLADPAIYDTLGLLRELLTGHEAAMARLLEALVSSARVADGFAPVSLEPGSPIFDDLVPVIREIVARPDLFADLVAALEDPRVAELGPRFHDFMTYRDEFYYDAVTQEVIGAFATEVDRAAANSGFNRSIWQRVLHLLDDVHGVPLCNKYLTQIQLGVILVNNTYEECALFQIDDLAAFYVRSLAYARDANGNFIYDQDGDPVHAAHMDLMWGDPLLEAAVTDTVLELATGISGFGEHPTPQALNRMLFLDPQPDIIGQLIDPPHTRFGEVVVERHRGTLPAWELNGFYDAVQPLVQPFVDHGAEDLFVDLLVVMHRHWPARDSADHQQGDENAAGYAWASNVAAYEPIIAEILGSGDLLPAVVENMPALRAVAVNGRPFAAILGGAADYFLQPRDGLLNRNGDSTSTTADGRPVTTLSIWQIVADGHAKKEELLAGAPARADAWKRASSGIVDIFARGVYEEGTGWRFANGRLRGVALSLIDFVEARLQAHDAAADRAAWLGADLPATLEDALSGPIFSGLMDLAVAVDARPEARRALEELAVYLLDETTSREGFRGLITALGDSTQLLVWDDLDMVPLARVVGGMLAPERGWIDSLLGFAVAARAAEGDIASSEESTLVRLLRGGYVEHRLGSTPLEDILDGVFEVHRARPYADLDRDLTSDDYAAVLRGVAEFLDAEKRGLRAFLQIVEHRKLP